MQTKKPHPAIAGCPMSRGFRDVGLLPTKPVLSCHNLHAPIRGNPRESVAPLFSQGLRLFRHKAFAVNWPALLGHFCLFERNGLATDRASVYYFEY